MSAKKRQRRGRPVREKPAEQHSEKQLPDRRATVISVAVLALIGLVFFWRIVFAGEILTGGDVLAAAAIFEDYAHEQMAAGHLPLWNPYIFSGMPFFDSMSWSAFVYPNFWIKFVLEKIPGVQLPRLFFLFLHYELAALGMFFYLRSRKVGHFGAAIAGAAFMLSPHIVGLATIGHGGKVLATAYLPLVIMAAHRLLETGERRWVAVLGLVGGLQFLARHVQVSYYTWLAVVVLAAYCLVVMKREGAPAGRLAVRGGALVGGVVLAALLAAVLLIPLQAYSGFSTRAAEAGGMGFENATMWSMNPKELMTLLVPSFYGLANETYWGTMPFQQVSHYVGYAVLCLAALSLLKRRGSVTFLLILTAVGVVMAFGRHIGPIYRLIYTVLPGFSRFRVPAMALLLVQFALAALAGFGASIVLGETPVARVKWKRWAPALAGVGILVGLIVVAARSGLATAAGASLMTKHAGVSAAALRGVGIRAAAMAANDAWLLMIVAAVTGAVVFLAGTRRIPRVAAAVLLIAVVVADVSVVNARFMRPEKMRPLSVYYPENPAVAFLKRQPGVFRIAPLGPGFSSNEWMYHRIQSIGGYHPAKLAAMDEFVGRIGIGNLKLMALLNVKYLVGPDDLQHPAFNRVAPGVYENLAFMPRVFLVGDVKTVSTQSMVLGEVGVDSFNPTVNAAVAEELPGPVVSAEGSSARLVSYESHRIEVTASIAQPCLLVFSEVYYPLGWRASVDGEEAAIHRTNYVLRSVYLEPGQHTVVMEYVPTHLRAGALISLLAALVVAGLWAWPDRASRGRRSGA
jgi:hypothetical protein